MHLITIKQAKEIPCNFTDHDARCEWKTTSYEMLQSEISFAAPMQNRRSQQHYIASGQLEIIDWTMELHQIQIIRCTIGSECNNTWQFPQSNFTWNCPRIYCITHKKIGRMAIVFEKRKKKKIRWRLVHFLIYCTNCSSIHDSLWSDEKEKNRLDIADLE